MKKIFKSSMEKILVQPYYYTVSGIHKGALLNLLVGWNPLKLITAPSANPVNACTGNQKLTIRAQ